MSFINKKRLLASSFSVLVTVLGLSFATDASAQGYDRSTFTNCPAATDHLPLTDGRTADYPVCMDMAREFAITGVADLDKVTSLLAPMGLYPIPVAGKALITIYLLNFGKTTFGGYNAIDLAILVSRTPNLPGGMALLDQLKTSVNHGVPSPDIGLYYPHLITSTEMSVRIGVDILGMDKILGKVKFDVVDGKLIFKASHNGQNYVNIRVDLPSQASPQPTDGNTFNDVFFKGVQAWEWSQTSGNSSFNGAWNPKSDVLAISPRWSGGKFLSDIHFTPMSTAYVPYFNVVLKYTAPTPN